MKPVVYDRMHRIKVSELDPCRYLRTAVYSGYFVDHRLDCLHKYATWDIKTLPKLPCMTWVRRIEIDFT